MLSDILTQSMRIVVFGVASFAALSFHQLTPVKFNWKAGCCDCT